MENGKKKSHKKVLIVLIVVLILTSLFAILFYYSGIFKKGQSDQEKFLLNIPDSWNIDKKNIEFHDNGNVIYQPAENTISYDENSQTIYYDNLIIVYLKNELVDSELNEIANSINGVVAGYVKGPVNTLQIATNNLKYDEMNEKITLLSKDERVFYARCDSPIIMDFSDWENESDVGNEASPNGKDWWAEAIGAYSAWDYEYLSKPVAVGIVDNGFDLDHADLLKNDKSVILMINSNSEENHGTHVAGLICAQPNNIGIRGLASNAHILCADAASDTDSRILDLSSLNEWYTQMLIVAKNNNVPIVINNSWGSAVTKKEKEDFWNKYFIGGTYWDTEIVFDKDAFREETFQCIAYICNLLENGYDDFIIVESAGNGYKDDNGYNLSEGYDISNELGSNFCGISEKAFQEMKKSQWGNVISNYTYQDIIDHVVIVGAYQNEKNLSGAYKFTSFSNYGDTVSIVAPGKDIYSTICYSEDLYCPVEICGYDSGTSMSAPIVTGSLAYIWSLDSTMTAGEVKDILVNHNGGATATKAGKTYPALNIGASVKYVIDKKNLVEEEPITKPKQSEPKSDAPLDDRDNNNSNDNKQANATPNGFTIQGSWKSIGSYGFGQAQPGATVTFNETHCNFYSPYDTYQFYQENGKWRLSCKNVLWQDVQYFTVTILDIDNIEIVYDGSKQKTVLHRIIY